MKNKCHWEIGGHSFKGRGNLYICEWCGFAVGKKWMDDWMKEHIFLTIDLTAPIGEQLVSSDGTRF